jgi:hypothetical protein
MSRVRKIVKPNDQLFKRCLAELEWASRKVEELNRNGDKQDAAIAEMRRDVEIIKKRDATMPKEWTARTPHEPPNFFQ